MKSERILGAKMKLSPDNKDGMWICNALMVRADVSAAEKRFITEIQRAILADPLEYCPTTEALASLMAIWRRGKALPLRGKVKTSVERIELANAKDRLLPAVAVACGRCGYQVEVFGRGIASARRGGIMLRDRCPFGEKNFYDVSDYQEEAAP
jgi:hypothetical protein